MQNAHRKYKFEVCIFMVRFKFQTKRRLSMNTLFITVFNHIQKRISTWLSNPSEIVALLMEKGSSE